MEIAEGIAALSALAQGTRLDAFRLLVKHEPAGLPAGEIATALGVPNTTLSTHLALLARARLVQSSRQGVSIIYRANLKTLGELMVFLVKDCCGGRPEMCAPLLVELSPCCPPKTEKADV